MAFLARRLHLHVDPATEVLYAADSEGLDSALLDVTCLDLVPGAIGRWDADGPIKIQQCNSFISRAENVRFAVLLFGLSMPQGRVRKNKNLPI